MAITYQNTTKKEWASIAYNLALQLTGEEDETKAIKRLETEKKLVKRNLARR